jgi:O6-methylguanine-DNA--protein-cysteine methyltransferase
MTEKFRQKLAEIYQNEEGKTRAHRAYSEIRDVCQRKGLIPEGQRYLSEGIVKQIAEMGPDDLDKLLTVGQNGNSRYFPVGIPRHEVIEAAKNSCGFHPGLVLKRKSLDASMGITCKIRKTGLAVGEIFTNIRDRYRSNPR